MPSAVVVEHDEFSNRLFEAILKRNGFDVLHRPKSLAQNKLIASTAVRLLGLLFTGCPGHHDNEAEIMDNDVRLQVQWVDRGTGDRRSCDERSMSVSDGKLLLQWASRRTIVVPLDSVDDLQISSVMSAS